MKSPICLVNRKQCASFRIACHMLAIAPLWLMLPAANLSAHAQTSDDVSIPSAAASAAPSPADWTQFLRDNMQRWNPYETIIGVNNVGSLQAKWKKPIGLGTGDTFSAPAVANGVVYFGSDDNNVYALNAATGAQLWNFATGGRILSSPAVANGVVYIGSDDKNVYALNAATGAKLWSYATGSGIESSPAVANGVVYVGSFDENLYALNASTGGKLWTYHMGAFVLAKPAVANGVVYIGIYAGATGSGDLYAVDANTGSLRWKIANGGSPDATPVVANGLVYISGDGNLYARNASTGAMLWSYGAGGSFSSPAVANGVVYVVSEAGRITALNASTGVFLWTFTATSYVQCSPAVANGVVYFASYDGNLYSLNAGNGGLLWTYPTGGTSAFRRTSSPTIVDGVVYIRAQDNVYAFAPGTSTVSADLFLRIQPTPTTVHQGDLLTYAFPVWNLGPNNAFQEVLNTQVPAGTTFDYIRISGTPGLGTCTHPPFGGTGQIICHENAAMAPNTTWTVRLTVKVTGSTGTVITESAATIADTPDPNMANNTATVSIKVQ